MTIGYDTLILGNKSLLYSFVQTTLQPSFIDHAQSFGRHSQFNVAILLGQIKTLIEKVWIKPSFCPLLGMGNVITAYHSFSGYLTNF